MKASRVSVLVVCLLAGLATVSFGQYGSGYGQPYANGNTCLPTYPNGYGQYQNGYGQNYPSGYGRYPNSYGQQYPNQYGSYQNGYGGYNQYEQAYPGQPQVVVVPPRVVISPPPVVYGPPTVLVRPNINYGYGGGFGRHGGWGGRGGRRW